MILTTLLFDVYHMSGEIFTFKKHIPTEKYSFFLKKIFYMEFPTGIKELTIGILFSKGF